AELGPQVLPPPVPPAPAGGHLRDEAPLRLADVALKGRGAAVLGQGQAPLGVVELVPNGRLPELVEPVKAVEAFHRLQGPVEDEALEGQLVRSQLAAAPYGGLGGRVDVTMLGQPGVVRLSPQPGLPEGDPAG